MEKQPYYNPTTTLLPDKKLQIIFAKLDSVKSGTVVDVTDQENIPFIKQYIDCYHSVDFNSDYTRLRKLF